MLINLTNHPFSLWGAEQRAAAAQYGEVKELPFPPVDPHWTEEELDAAVEKCFSSVISAGPKAVLLQGEYVLCYRLTDRLKGAGIKVLAACAVRCTEDGLDEKGNPCKLSIFRFVQFREY